MHTDLFDLNSNVYFKLVFPRDETFQNKPGRDGPLSLYPGTKKISCPGIPLSRDKSRSTCVWENDFLDEGTSKTKILDHYLMGQLLIT